MYFKPFALDQDKLENSILKEDKQQCKPFGSCGIGNKAIYLGTRYFNRIFYIPRSQISNVFKRILMTANGGFQIPYLVVSYGKGKEKKCMFLIEEELDQLLSTLQNEWPEIKVGKNK